MAVTSQDLSRRFGIADAGTERVVWFGKHRIAVSDIASVDADAISDRPISGLLIAASAFIVIAAVFAFLVFDNGWRERYLIATALLVVLGAAGFREVFSAKSQRFYTVQIAMRSSGPVSFASAEEREAGDFLDMLRQEGVPVRRAG